MLTVIEAGAVTTPTGLAEDLHIGKKRNHGRTSDQLAADLGELGLEVEPLEMDDGIVMAQLLDLAAVMIEAPPKIGGLRLGDAACLSVAVRLDLPAVFSD